MVKRLLVLAILGLLWTAPASAQESTLRQVFLRRDVDGTTSDRLTFIDLVSGETTNVTVDGERYTTLGGNIIYYDRAANRVKVASPGGLVYDHPFMQPTTTARRIDWIVSGDGRKLAWTLTEGEPTALSTTTQVANIDGTNAQVALTDGPRDGIRAMPVAFDTDGVTLYMDYQPDTIGDLTPFRQYAGLFSVSLTDGSVETLPDEPGCFCGAAVGAGTFLRLALTQDQSAFSLRVHDLTAGTTTRIPALNLVGFTQAGDMLIAPDGARAVYALSQVRGFGTPQQTVRTVFVLVDLAAGTQSALTDPITTLVRPVAWTEDDSAVLFTSPALDGTWKVSLSDGALNRVAVATFVGVVHGTRQDG